MRQRTMNGGNGTATTLLIAGLCLSSSLACATEFVVPGAAASPPDSPAAVPSDAVVNQGVPRPWVMSIGRLQLAGTILITGRGEVRAGTARFPHLLPDPCAP